MCQICYLYFSTLTLHDGTVRMEKTVDGNIAEFLLSSCSSVNSVIEIPFMAVVADQRLRENGETL